MHKKLLLFGGTGFVGSSVARKALLRGYKVVVATRRGTPDAGSPIEALARRAKVVGGRAAALEATKLGAAGLAGGAPILEEEKPDGAVKRDLDAGDTLAAFVESAEEESAIEFVSIDAASRAQVFHFLHDHPDATAVVSTVGLLTTDYDTAREVNGDVNTNICAGICHEKLVPAVQKFVYVSAEPYHLYLPRTLGSRRLLKGYFHGKTIAEKAILNNLGTRGVVLRPGFIYGTRFIPAPSATSEGGTVVPLPLGIIGKPLDVLLTAVGGVKLLTPPVDVEVVAETAVRALDWAALPDRCISGIITTQEMKRICAMEEPLVKNSAAQQAPPPGEQDGGGKEASDAKQTTP